MKTLDELNATPYEYDWSGTYRIQVEYVVGSGAGVRYSRGLRNGQHTGAKYHLIRINRVIAWLDQPDEATAKKRVAVGEIWDMRTCCGYSVQREPRAPIDTDKVNCKKCLR